MPDPVALVTGASSGIGRELARLLAADGRDLLLTARRGDALQELAGQLRARYDVQCTVIPHDLGAVGGAATLARIVADMEVEVDALINNAGVGASGPFLELDLERQLAMMRLNVEALTELSWRFGRPMAARGGGRILNVASTAAFQPGPWMATYYATKAYVLSLGEALAVELAGSGVSVTTLCPGPTRTGFAAAADMEGARLFRAGAMDPARVAAAGYRGMQRGKRVVVPGIRNRITSRLVGLLPRGLVLRTVAALNRD